eukprot:760200-Hanusia_phi.AAC.2
MMLANIFAREEQDEARLKMVVDFLSRSVTDCRLSLLLPLPRHHDFAPVNVPLPDPPYPLLPLSSSSYSFSSSSSSSSSSPPLSSTLLLLSSTLLLKKNRRKFVTCYQVSRLLEHFISHEFCVEVMVKSFSRVSPPPSLPSLSTSSLPSLSTSSPLSFLASACSCLLSAASCPLSPSCHHRPCDSFAWVVDWHNFINLLGRLGQAETKASVNPPPICLRPSSPSSPPPLTFRRIPSFLSALPGDA